MNEKIVGTEMRKNNRNKLIEKILNQKQKITFNSDIYKIQLKNMLKEIKQREEQKIKCQYEQDQKLTWITKLSPQPRHKICATQNVKLKILRTTRNENIKKKKQGENNAFNQQFSLNSNSRCSTSPNHFNFRNTILIYPTYIKDTDKVMEQMTLKDQRCYFDFKNISKFSSWSRKSSKSFIN